MKWTCWALLVLATLSSSAAKRSFLLTGPKLFDIGTKETVILTFFDVNDSGEVQIRLLNSTGELIFTEVTTSIENGTSKAVDLPIPSSIPEHTTLGKLEVVGTLGNYSINQSIAVGFRNPKALVFINTDKPLYKAGQTVKIRILVTNSDLLLLREAKGEIWITDPKKTRVEQWTDTSFRQGLLHRELRLPEEPVLGTWAVHVRVNNNEHLRAFKVEEYVLPTFEVTIAPPPYVLKNGKNATWKICAKYTYGKPVKGELLTKLSLTRYNWQKQHDIIENKTEINGCQDVTLPVEELLAKHRYYYSQDLELFAEVTEYGTESKINSTSRIRPSNSEYTISRDDRDAHTWYFRPHIPLKITMVVKTPDNKPLNGELIKVCVETVRQVWNEIQTVTDVVSSCKNYTSNQYGYVIFTIPPQNSNTVSINVEAVDADYSKDSKNKGMYQPRDNFRLTPWFSPSGSHLQLEKLPTVDCSIFRPNIKIKQVFHYTFNEPGTKKIFYQIMSRGEIIEYGDFDIVLEDDNATSLEDYTYLPDHQLPTCANKGYSWDIDIDPPKHIGKYYFSMRLTRDIVPKVRVLLYTVTRDGEVVADSMWYDIDLCFADRVKMKFNNERQFPGSEVGIHLKTEPLSLCSVGIVDKSVYVLSKADLLTGSKINEKLRPLDTSYHTPPLLPTPNYLHCGKKVDDTRQTEHGYSGYVDSITAFATGGGVVLTDLELETRPCRKSPGNEGCVQVPTRPNDEPQEFVESLPMEEGSAEIEELTDRVADEGVHRSRPSYEEKTVTIRTNFPETWLFDLYDVGENGELEINQTMPDSITEWQGTAVCIHPLKGLALSEPASIVAFQPFFTSLTLPFSVVRNETVPVKVTVFNYLQECLPIKVDLDQTEEFIIINSTSSEEICVCGEQSVTKLFHIKLIELGQMNITVTASTSDKQDVCDNLVKTASLTKRSDTITKLLLVEPEGFLKEETTNTYVCMEDVEDSLFRTEHSLNLPDNVIEDSARAFFSFTGDLMGPTLEGLERLVRMPTGCGEQNMISLVPNIVVLDYLNATGRLTEVIRQKAVNNIRQGYIRQHKYRRDDGSYSAFGQKDKEGSIWLTAFVVKTFASARRYITIDDEELEASRNWIISQQKDNGCFPMIGTIHNQAIKERVDEDDQATSALTAYVLISLSESGVVSKPMISQSLQCIEAKNKPSNYSLALFSYAASLVNDPSASNYMDQLLHKAEKGDLWKHSDRSIRVETAAYALLALLEINRNGDFQKASLIVPWLIARRNPYGGFYSTQDTVVALQALGRYGALINRHDLDMEILIKTDEIDEARLLNEENKLLMQRINLGLENDVENYVEIEAMGTGCALLQTVLRYNLPTPEPTTDFELSVQTEKSPANCRKVGIRICVSYNFANGSNMAIVEAKMVSGYVPIKNTLEKLLAEEELGIRRYEIEDGTVNLYFTSLTEKSRCAGFDVLQEFAVLDTKPANVKVYDYYNNENVVSVPYAIEETCN